MAIEIDLEGKKPFESKPKPLLERTMTIGEVKNVTWFKSTKKKKDKAGVEQVVDVSKVVVTIATPNGEVAGFYPASVKKGATPAYNTMLYNNLNKLGLIEDFAKVQKDIVNEDALKDYLISRLVGKKVKFVPETIPSPTGQDYSIVKLIEGFA